ncbi:hypothetical protein J1792_01075 [Streptomyces triculaminicus]|uniref:Uncharacterized protein n=2 Tax=Streptomyces TaxID=1883 RepID=A0A939FHE6_9ACTN|nr:MULTISPECIES: hypothetical protein [Streptomyces]MBO0651443.1 hypothetical protein [Streptomyces triculaminicus]QSY47566.1 hypothetical protein J3S04_19955 [Streptomyces griseocarneus]
MAENTAVTTPAKQLLDGLYAEGVQADANWDGVSEEALLKLREAAASGDEALQSLMANLAFSKFEDAEQATRLSSSLAGIKQFMVTEIFEELPTTSVEDLRAAAEAAGYDVEILG